MIITKDLGHIKLEEAPLRDEVASLGQVFSPLYPLVAPPWVVSDEILLGSLRDGRLRVIAPIKVKLTTEGEYFVAESKEFNEFGYGENFSETIVNLQNTIAELYLTLEESQDSLGFDLQRVWKKLNRKIKRL